MEDQFNERDRKRFEKRLRRNLKTGCLEWTGTKLEKMCYGRFYKGSWKTGNQKRYLAHRVAWIMSGRSIPKNKPLVLHKCDNPCCCEISHLWVGTHQDNSFDKSKKGRNGLVGRLPYGVSERDAPNSRFKAEVRFKGRLYFLGYHKTVQKAADLARTKRLELYGVDTARRAIK